MTPRIFAALAASAAWAVGPSVSTPKLNDAGPGAARAWPVPRRVMVRPLGELEPGAAAGRPTPDKATAAANSAATAAIEAIFIVSSLVAYDVNTPRARATSRG